MDSKIVVLGPTGAGKSTLIQFLNGCDFKLEPHRALGFELLPVNPQALRDDFAISSAMSSVTKTVTNLLLNHEVYDLEQRVFVVDTPGFEDTAGSEADVENFLLLHREFRKKGETRFIFLVDCSAFGGQRGASIAKLAEQISLVFDEDVINDGLVVFQSCSVGFTHGDLHLELERAKEAPMFFIEEKLKAMKNQTRINDAARFEIRILNAILNDEIKSFMIDETRMDRKALINDILSRPGLSNGFRYRMSREVKNYISHTATRKLTEFTASVTGRNRDFNLAVKLISEIKELSELSREESHQALFDSSGRILNEISQYLDTVLNMIRNLFNNAQLNKDAIEKIMKYISFLSAESRTQVTELFSTLGKFQQVTSFSMQECKVIESPANLYEACFKAFGALDHDNEREVVATVLQSVSERIAFLFEDWKQRYAQVKLDISRQSTAENAENWFVEITYLKRFLVIVSKNQNLNAYFQERIIEINGESFDCEVLLYKYTREVLRSNNSLKCDLQYLKNDCSEISRQQKLLKISHQDLQTTVAANEALNDKYRTRLHRLAKKLNLEEEIMREPCLIQ